MKAMPLPRVESDVSLENSKITRSSPENGAARENHSVVSKELGRCALPEPPRFQNRQTACLTQRAETGGGHRKPANCLSPLPVSLTIDSRFGSQQSRPAPFRPWFHTTVGGYSLRKEDRESDDLPSREAS